MASDSPDHLHPKGTALDNSANRRFNQKLYTLYRSLGRPLHILDLGCAGGAFVRDCLSDGHIAVGIEGSDYSLHRGRAEWPVLGGRALFTADAGKPFEVVRLEASRDVAVRFDVIVLFEVFEHFPEEDLPTVFQNIRNHLEPGGLVIASISPLPHAHHQSVHDEQWWTARFRREQLSPRPEFVRYFASQFVRGPKFRAPGSFHLIATDDPARVPALPPQGGFTQLLDEKWYGSRIQRKMRRMLGLQETV